MSNKPAGWFSRRHRDNQAHEAARQLYLQRQSDKMARAKMQNDATAARKAKEAEAKNKKDEKKHGMVKMVDPV